MATELVKQLGREFKRAGKKSFILAGLFVVGLCIWLPMVWKSVFRKTESPAKTATSNTPVVRPASQISTSEPVINPDSPQLDWKRVYRRVEMSDLVQALPLDDLVRDPFEKDWIQAKNKPLTTKTEADVAAENDPNRFLVLSATLAGRSGGAAVISDRVYRLGQEVPDQGPIRFVLKEIRPDRVVLERAGSLFELRLKELEQAGKESTEIVQ